MNRAIQTARSGALAQLVERLHGMQEVSGSTPLSSTIVTSKHRKMLGGTATFPHIAAPTHQAQSPSLHPHSRMLLRRSALATTLTDDRAMAAAAIIGDSRTPKTG